MVVRRIVFGLLISACAFGAELSRDLDGRYERQTSVRNLETGADEKMVDFLEIEHRGPSAIFFVYESWHTNGHSCRLWGSAKERETGVYEYVEETDAAPDAETCKARVHADEKFVAIDDVGGFCRADHCGARGEIGKDYFPVESRTPLKGAVQVPW